MSPGHGSYDGRELLVALLPALAAVVMTAWRVFGPLDAGESALPWLLLSLAVIPAGVAFAANLLTPVATDQRRAERLALPVLVAVPLVFVANSQFRIASGVIDAAYDEAVIARVVGYPLFFGVGLAAMGAVVLSSRLGALLSGRIR